MVSNNLIGVYFRFSVVSLLYTCCYAGSCKNQAASKNIDLMREKQKTFNLSNSTEIDPKDHVITSQGNSERPNDDAVQMESNDRDKNPKNHLAQTNQVDTQPSFTLKDITTKAGTQQPIMLEVAGITEGYSIKSTSVTKNGTYYTKEFGVTKLNKKPIPPSSLPITLTTDPKLQAGSYELKIKIGKTGKSSQKTEQWVKCNIHVIKDEAKNHCLNKDKADTAKDIQAHPEQNHTIPAEPSFTLKDITIQAGTQQSTMLEVAGITEGYSIKSISVSQNKSYHTSKFGVDILKNKPIPPSGLPVTLTPDPALEAGPYELKIKIGKTGKGSHQTEQWVKCRIHVTQDEAKKLKNKMNHVV